MMSKKLYRKWIAMMMAIVLIIGMLPQNVLAAAAYTPDDGHEHQYSTEWWYMPTCTEPGKAEYFCYLCGFTTEPQEVPALGHHWGEAFTAQDGSTVMHSCVRVYDDGTTCGCTEDVSDILSFEIAPVTLTEGHDGCLTCESDNEGKRHYYWYYDGEPQQITVVYRDGRTVTGNRDEIYDQTGEWVNYYLFDVQNWEHPLTTGDYTISASFKDKTTTYTLRIVENANPVESIEVEPIVILEGTHGMWDDYTDADGVDHTYWYYYLEPYQMTVTYADGTVLSDNKDAIYYQTGEYVSYFYEAEQSGEYPLEPGIYEGVVGYGGKIVPYTIEIFESPVASIEIPSIEIVEGTNGHYQGEHNSDSREYQYVWYYNVELPQITINYKDGHSITGTREEIYELTGEGIDDGQHESQTWGVGAHVCEASFMGVKTYYTITITETPVASIEVAPIEIVEGTEGYQNIYTDEYGIEHSSWTYYTYPHQITITYKNGQSIQGTPDEIYNQTGEHLDVDPWNQTPNNPWGIGAYECDAYFMGVHTTYTVNIIETSIDSIIIETKEIIEKTNGYWTEDGGSEKYWYYYTEPDRTAVQMTVMYKDGSVYSGTFYEICSAICEDTGHYPDYDCVGISQSYENQLEVGENYTGILRFDGYTTEYEIQIVENHNPVISVVIEPLEIIENTNGYWQNYGEPEQYWWYETHQGNNNIQISVIYKDGTSYSGKWQDVISEIETVTGRRPEYNDIWIPQSYDQQLQVGELYSELLSFDGYITNYEVRIVENPNPVTSVVIDRIEIIENTNGDWVNYGEPEQYWYYQTKPYYTGAQMTVTYLDGSVYSGTWHEVRDAIQEATGREPDDNPSCYYWYDITQSYSDQLKVGETYTGIMVYDGYTTEYSVTIIETPIESISVESRSVIEGTNGYYQTSWNNGTTYWYYYSIEPQTYRVVLKDGEVITGSSSDIYSALGEYPSYFISQSRYDEATGSYIDGLSAGEYTYEIRFLGKTCVYSFSIVESPIDHVTVSPIRLIENYDGSVMEGGWYKYNLTSNGSITVDVSLKDGSTQIISDAYVDANGLNFYLDNVQYRMALEDTQSTDNSWGKGSHYVTAVSPDGITTATLEYVVVPSPVKEIILDEIVLFENLSGGWIGPEGDKWFTYELGRPSGWVVLEDGSNVPIQKYGEIFLDDGSRYYVDLRTDQSPQNHWRVGEHEAVVRVAGFQETVKVNVLPCPVANVEIFPITIVENQLGHWYQGDNGERWFCYDMWMLEVEGSIHFLDGSTCMLSEAMGSGMIRQYGPLLWTTQSYDNQWEVGENTAFCTIGDIDYPVCVIIEENPIREIAIDDLYLNEWEDFTVNSDGRMMLGFCDSERLHVNVELKDGSILQMTKGAYEFGLGAVNPGFIYKGQAYGFLRDNRDLYVGEVSFFDLESFSADKPRSEWRVGDVITLTAYIWGTECHFKVHFEPKQYTGLTIENYNGLVLIFSTEDGSTETMRATEVYLYTGGDMGQLYTDKVAFSALAEMHFTFDGKTYGDILEENGIDEMKNVQISVGNLTSNVLEDASWFAEQLSPDRLNIAAIPEAVALAARSLGYVAEFDGEITEGNIDFLIVAAFTHTIGYKSSEVEQRPNGINMYRSSEEIIEAISNLFDISKDIINLSSSHLYNEESDKVLIPITIFDGDGDITEIMDTEEGTLIWNSKGISALVKNGILERIIPVPNAYTGSICEMADGSLWYVARSLVQTQYTGEVEIDGMTYEIENGKVIPNDYPEGTVSIKGCSLTLAGDIGLNFYLNMDADLVTSGAYAVFEQNGIISEPVLLSSALHQNRQYKLTYHVSAKEMDDTIILRIYDGDGNLITLYKDGEEYAEGYPYSVNTYVELALSKDSVSDELKDLMRSMRQYGDCAQEYFGYGIGTVGSVDVSLNTFEAYAMTYSATGSKVSYYGSSLLLKDMTTIRHYFTFTDRMENYSVSVNGTDASLVQKGSQCYVEIADIAAQDLEEMPVVVVTDPNGQEVYRLVYGAFSYADVVMNQSNNDQLKTLMAALYLYWQSAEAYFAK